MTETEPGDMWFSYNDIPLRWHHPIGLLHDLLVRERDLPWPLTVHFSQFPTEQILPCSTRDQVETVFMSSLKEADQLKHSGKVVSLMQKKDHNQLWLGLVSDKFDQFWAINRRLMEPLVGEERIRHIPVRLHLSSPEGGWQILQRPVSPVKGPEGDQEPRLFCDLVNDFELPTSSKLSLQGVCPCSETPLTWLSEHLSYPDNFLHIAVHLQ